MAKVLEYCIGFVGNLLSYRDDEINLSLDRFQSEGRVQITSFSLDELIEQINSNETNLNIDGLQRLKFHIPNEGSVLINAVIDANLLPKLFEFLHHDNYDLVFEAISTLRFIAFGVDIKIGSMIDLDNFRVLSKLLSSTTRFDIVEQIIWFVGGIYSSNSSTRFIDKLVSRILLIEDHPDHELSLIRALAWTLTGVMIKEATKSVELILPLTVDLLRFPNKTPHASTIINSYKSSPIVNVYNADIIEARFGNIPILNDFLISDNNDDAILALRAVSLIILSTPISSQIALDKSFLSTMYEFLYHPQALLQYEAIGCIAATMGKSRESAIAVVNSDLLPIINGRLTNSDDAELKEQCVCVYVIFLIVASDQIETLLNFGVLDVLCGFMKICNSSSPTNVVVIGVLMIFIKTAEKCGHLETMLSTFKQNGGVEKLEELRNNPSHEISTAAVYFIEKYFSPEIPMNQDDGDVESILSVAVQFTNRGIKIKIKHEQL